jgi:hypothetical protein
MPKMYLERDEQYPITMHPAWPDDESVPWPGSGTVVAEIPIELVRRYKACREEASEIESELYKFMPSLT